MVPVPEGELEYRSGLRLLWARAERRQAFRSGAWQPLPPAGGGARVTDKPSPLSDFEKGD